MAAVHRRGAAVHVLALLNDPFTNLVLKINERQHEAAASASARTRGVDHARPLDCVPVKVAHGHRLGAAVGVADDDASGRLVGVAVRAHVPARVAFVLAPATARKEKRE